VEFALGYWLSTMRSGQVWRLVSDIFVHWSILHLLFNMFWLRDLGGMIERQRGGVKLLALVLVTALLSNFAEYVWSFPVASGGMSGVVYGLFGYVWMKGRFERQLGMGVSRETVFIMLAWLVLCMTGLIGPIANAAHVAGLLVGVVVGYAPSVTRRLTRGMRQ
jgi:GlpG protein